MAKKKKEITLRSSDGALLHADEFLAEQSGVVRRAINSNPGDIALNVPSVTESVLHLVTEFCKKQAEFTAEINVAAIAGKKAKGVVDDSVDNTTEGEDEIAVDNGMAAMEKKRRDWEEEFLLVDHDVLYYLIMAADDLEIDSLRNLTCRKLADLIKNKSPQQIRGMLGIDDDFSEEEKQEIKKELQLKSGVCLRRLSLLKDRLCPGPGAFAQLSHL
ncbi:hypothetical protein MUK42_18213 [Musa troglodytarum]|uniref:SKP1-like protein n=1 Tax=Musa troglodytarum TaxID=320322 RepID=A0A9E7H6A1_9LILI|nr:hypothetical protein MUK42_18213 [Musa troglodytarum]